MNPAKGSPEFDEQRRKLETLGHLSANIVHDFNNLLMVIEGYSRMLLEEPALSEAGQESAQEILRATERAGALTRQLLAFSRKKDSTPQRLDVNAELRRMKSMMARLLGETVSLEYELCPAPCAVTAAQGQLEQVLLNLIVNARDAMPVGGKILVRTSLSDGQAHLEVHDTGTGIPANLLPKIFEPYFTTKDPGRGTGIGLAQVQEAVYTWGGSVAVSSIEGTGSQFRLYWPHPEAAPVATPIPHKILLVEDEDSIRTLIRRVLEQNGYSVLDAPSEAVALDLARNAPHLDLLITDLELPGGEGRRLARLALESHPEMKTIFISGYLPESTNGSEIALQKPFVPNTLVLTVQSLLKIDRT